MEERSDLDEVLGSILRLCRAALPEAEVHAQSSFTRDLGMDSLQALELISDIETEFKIAIPAEALPEADTVEDVAKLVLRFRKQVK